MHHSRKKVSLEDKKKTRYTKRDLFRTSSETEPPRVEADLVTMNPETPKTDRYPFIHLSTAIITFLFIYVFKKAHA